MNLREYQAKQIFSTSGIAVPGGETARDAATVKKIVEQLKSPVVLKPQMGFKKRGKLGIIRFADDSATAAEEAAHLFNSEVRNEKIRVILVEEKLLIAQELYAAVTIDYSRRCPVIILSQQGGVDIEELSEKNPEKIHRLHVDIISGLKDIQRQEIISFLGTDILPVIESLYAIFRKYDADLVEVNPLVRTFDGKIVAVDGVLNLNSDSLFRHPELNSYIQDIDFENPVSEEARKNSWTYIDLPGDIAILSSGAGLTMTILDLIHFAGGSAANFLDTAQIDESGIYDAFDLLFRAKSSKAMLVNIFAGLNRCDSLAMGIRRYIEDKKIAIPLVIRMVGNGEDIGHKILMDIGVQPYQDLEEAVEQIVKLSREP